MAAYMFKVAPDERFGQLEGLFLGSVAPLLNEHGACMTDQEKFQLLTVQLNFLLRRVFLEDDDDSNSTESDLFIATRLISYDGSVARLQVPFGADRRPSWLEMSAEVSVLPEESWQTYPQPVSQLGLVVTVNRNTRALFPRGYTPLSKAGDLGRSRDVFVLDSLLVSVGVSKRPRLLESPSPPALHVSLRLEPLSRQWNMSTQSHSCARLAADGRWHLDACPLTVLPDNRGFSCGCSELGTYALALLTKARSPLQSVLNSLHVPVVTGCLLSLPPLLYALGVLLVHCLRRPSVPAGLRLQGAFVLTAAMVIFMVSARDTPQTASMAVNAALLQCLILSAMSTQMALKMHVFGEQHRLRSLRGQPNFFKYIVFFTSCGIPLLVTAATVTTQYMHGWSELHSWWILYSSSFFYGVVVPVAVLLLVDTCLLLYVRALLVIKVSMTKCETEAWIRERVHMMMGSHMIEMMLVLLVVSSALYINFRGLACEILFAIFCVLTSATLLVYYVVHGEEGLPVPPCFRKHSPDAVDEPGHEREPPATLRSHSVLRADDASQRPAASRLPLVNGGHSRHESKKPLPSRARSAGPDHVP
ncbi:uncharacterized protein LOC119114541 [Pollicipes pollicipes]|uniref:uncharacterized protein LOC119114541 n=1 Tax=Pollicipes pollicipes TaxID=41117 RepID=UPI00188573F9|nr:uncharacterized protein LOC119114541 [Pollicipes pollicipes]